MLLKKQCWVVTFNKVKVGISKHFVKAYQSKVYLLWFTGDMTDALCKTMHNSIRQTPGFFKWTHSVFCDIETFVNVF
jgi:hypothetical protein